LIRPSSVFVVLVMSRYALVTTCLNESRRLAEWRHGVEAQTRRPDEIIIADAQSTDGTTELLQQWATEDPRVKLLVKRCSVAAGRNLAIRAAESPNIVSTDMGCRLDPRWFEAMCQPLEEDADIMVVAGNYEADPATIQSPAARAACRLANHYRPALGPGFRPSSRSIAYRKRVWEEVGGYPEDLSYAGDDTVFALQLLKQGYKTAYAPDAIVYWARHSALRGYWKEAYGYARGNGEAGITQPPVFQRHGPSYSRLWTHLRALNMATRGSVRAAFSLLLKGDVRAAALVPVLQYGIAVNAEKGYVVGAARGAVDCRDCRRRLNDGGERALSKELAGAPL
jgi:GT2 family glycosyltransferase